MKFQIGEQVNKIGSRDVLIISEFEVINGTNIYYTLNGEAYPEEQIIRFYPQSESDFFEDQTKHIVKLHEKMLGLDSVKFNIPSSNNILSDLERIAKRSKKRWWQIF